MLLTVDQIRQAVEKLEPYGFTFMDGDLFLREDEIATNKRIHDIDKYDLFLDRCIQEINKLERDSDLMIISHVKAIEVIFVEQGENENYRIYRHNGTIEGIREAREKTIQFVLEE